MSGWEFVWENMGYLAYVVAKKAEAFIVYIRYYSNKVKKEMNKNIKRCTMIL